MTVTLEIQRESYGRLVLDNADEIARRFFAEDISSVDPLYPSYDDRAATGSADSYDEADTTAVRRGMGLNRAPGRMWEWVRDGAPLELIDALPSNVDLIEISDAEFTRIRVAIHAALAGFVADGSGEWRRLAVATKILALKRPSLIPILDRNVLNVLGLHLPEDARHIQQVDFGVKAIEVIRREGRRNREAIAKIQASLTADGIPRPQLRILDALLWIAY